MFKKILNFNKQEKGKGLSLATRIKMLQRLPKALSQVKAGNTSENLLNKIRQLIYSFYWEKEVTKIIYNNTLNSDSKTSGPHRLFLNFSDKVNLKRSDKHVALSNFSIYDKWKYIRNIIQK